MIGAFPPPVGGAAMVNQLVFESLQAQGTPVERLDVKSPTLHVKGLGYHLSRLRVNARTLMELVRGARGLIYLVPDGGLGAYYSAVHAFAIRMFAQKSLVHHHTYRYINSRSFPISILKSVLGEHATHVFLTQGMADAFQRVYGTVNCLIVTNATYADKLLGSTTAAPAGKSLRCGHLSNLCTDKGFFEVARTFEILRDAGVDAQLFLAGPVLEDNVAARIDELVRRYGSDVTWKGPLSGSAKADFFASLDVFLFPTQFRQEAAPLVIYEALACGTFTISRSLGCIPEMISGTTGISVPTTDDYAQAVLSLLSNVDVKQFRSGREAILRSAHEAIRVSQSEYADLLEFMSLHQRGEK